MIKQEFVDRVEQLEIELGKIKSLALCNRLAIMDDSIDVSEFDGSFLVLLDTIRNTHSCVIMLRDELMVSK